VSSAELPRYVRQKGVQRATTTVLLVSDGEPVARVPVAVVLEVSEEAARPDVARSGRVNLFFERGVIRVSAVGTAMADAYVGDQLGVLVLSTGRVVRAKLVAPGEAEVQGP
jgi:Chaperone for flagella basal body P-ring formation